MRTTAPELDLCLMTIRSGIEKKSGSLYKKASNDDSKTWPKTMVKLLEACEYTGGLHKTLRRESQWMERIHSQIKFYHDILLLKTNIALKLKTIAESWNNLEGDEVDLVLVQVNTLLSVTDKVYTECWREIHGFDVRGRQMTCYVVKAESSGPFMNGAEQINYPVNDKPAKNEFNVTIVMEKIKVALLEHYEQILVVAASILTEMFDYAKEESSNGDSTLLTQLNETQLFVKTLKKSRADWESVTNEETAAQQDVKVDVDNERPVQNINTQTNQLTTSDVQTQTDRLQTSPELPYQSRTAGAITVLNQSQEDLTVSQTLSCETFLQQEQAGSTLSALQSADRISHRNQNSVSDIKSIDTSQPQVGEKETGSQNNPPCENSYSVNSNPSNVRPKSLDLVDGNLNPIEKGVNISTDFIEPQVNCVDISVQNEFTPDAEIAKVEQSTLQIELSVPKVEQSKLEVKLKEPIVQSVKKGSDSEADFDDLLSGLDSVDTSKDESQESESEATENEAPELILDFSDTYRVAKPQKRVPEDNRSVISESDTFITCASPIRELLDTDSDVSDSPLDNEVDCFLRSSEVLSSRKRKTDSGSDSETEPVTIGKAMDASNLTKKGTKAWKPSDPGKISPTKHDCHNKPPPVKRVANGRQSPGSRASHNGKTSPTKNGNDSAVMNGGRSSSGKISPNKTSSGKKSDSRRNSAESPLRLQVGSKTLRLNVSVPDGNRQDSHDGVVYRRSSEDSVDMDIDPAYAQKPMDDNEETSPDRRSSVVDMIKMFEQPGSEKSPPSEPKRSLTRKKPESSEIPKSDQTSVSSHEQGTKATEAKTSKKSSSPKKDNTPEPFQKTDISTKPKSVIPKPVRKSPKQSDESDSDKEPKSIEERMAKFQRKIPPRKKSEPKKSKISEEVKNLLSKSASEKRRASQEIIPNTDLPNGSSSPSVIKEKPMVFQSAKFSEASPGIAAARKDAAGLVEYTIEVPNREKEAAENIDLQAISPDDIELTPLIDSEVLSTKVLYLREDSNIPAQNNKDETIIADDSSAVVALASPEEAFKSHDIKIQTEEGATMKMPVMKPKVKVPEPVIHITSEIIAEKLSKLAAERENIPPEAMSDTSDHFMEGNPGDSFSILDDDILVLRPETPPLEDDKAEVEEEPAWKKRFGAKQILPSRPRIAQKASLLTKQQFVDLKFEDTTYAREFEFLSKRKTNPSKICSAPVSPAGSICTDISGDQDFDDRASIYSCMPSMGGSGVSGAVTRKRRSNAFSRRRRNMLELPTEDEISGGKEMRYRYGFRPTMSARQNVRSRVTSLQEDKSFQKSGLSAQARSSSLTNLTERKQLTTPKEDEIDGAVQISSEAIEAYRNKYNIRNVYDSLGTKLTLEDAVQQGVINLNTGCYVNPYMNKTFSLEIAVQRGFITVLSAAEQYERIRARKNDAVSAYRARRNSREILNGDVIHEVKEELKVEEAPQLSRLSNDLDGFSQRASFRRTQSVEVSKPSRIPEISARATARSQQRTHTGKATSFYGMISFNVDRIPKPFYIAGVLDTSTNVTHNYETALKFGLLEQNSSVFVDKRSRARISLDEAIDNDLISIAPNNQVNVESEPRMTDHFLVYGVMDTGNQKRITFKEAVDLQILKPGLETFKDTKYNVEIPLDEGIEQGYIVSKKINPESLRLYDGMISDTNRICCNRVMHVGRHAPLEKQFSGVFTSSRTRNSEDDLGLD